MDGVTILAKDMYALDFLINVNGYMFTFCLLVIIALSYLVLDGPRDQGNHAFASICFVVSLFLLVVSTFGSLATEHTEYKVTIDDSVNFNEFMERYEIVDQNGKLFTVKERAVSNE